MVYQPSNPPPMETVEEVTRWFFDELQTLSKSLSETNALDLRTVNQEPVRPREGLIVQADGTNWDPGEGAGSYVYQGGNWVLLSRPASSFTGLLNNVKVTVVTGNGTFTPQSGMVAVLVIATGGGGGGGGADADADSANYAGGGEGGGTIIKLLTAAQLGASASVTIGAAGTAGGDTGTNGTDGGDTIIDPAGTGATLTALGGDGGDGSADLSSGTHIGARGAGESGGTNGDLNLAAAPGQYVGKGGDSFWGFGGAVALPENGSSGNSYAGNAGIGYGAGGGGAVAIATTTGQAGGAGVAGVAFFIEFIGQT